MFKLAIERVRNRRYAARVRQSRRSVAPGERVRVVRGSETVPGTVLNVRAYAHGATEVYVRSDDGRWIAWVAVDSILPLEERR
jgi:hypothetical protein